MNGNETDGIYTLILGHCYQVQDSPFTQVPADFLGRWMGVGHDGSGQ